LWSLYLRCDLAFSVFDGTRSLDKRSSHLIVPVPVSPPRFHSDLNITLHAEDRLRILQAENQLAWFTVVGQISSPPVVNTQRLISQGGGVQALCVYNWWRE